MEKRIPVWVLVLVIFLGINVAVIFGWFVRHVDSGGQKLGKMAQVVTVVADFPSFVNQAFIQAPVSMFERSPLLIQNRFPHIDGFKRNGVLARGAATDDGYLLLAAYDNSKKQSTVKLLRISDQRVLHEWAPNIQKLAERHKTKSDFFDVNEITTSRFMIAHPILFDDGSLVFSGGGPLFKINACSNIELVVDGNFHHNHEQDADGNFWSPAVIEPPSYDKEKYIEYRDDAIAKISPDGKVLFKKSVSEILEENGYRGLLFGVGYYNKDAIHLNDVAPALYSSKYWKKDDLLLSMRTLSTVLLYRPSTNKIIWLKTGPWLKQHNPNFVGQSKISVFGNDVIDYPSRLGAVLPYEHNNIYLFDFADGSISTPYSEVLKKLDVRTLTGGHLSILENGDALINEMDYGRILRISQRKVIWEFSVKVDDKTAGNVSWGGYLTKEQVRHVLPVLEKSKCP